MVAGEPKIFGTPVTTCVYAVCLVHLILCILIMSYLVVGHPLDLEGIIISPVLQWVYGTFTMVSISIIVCAGVGALYAIESNLNVYGMLLLISTLLDAFLFVIFLLWGRSCSTLHSDSPYHLVATLSCGLRDGMLLFCLTLLIVFKLVAVWVVNKCRRYVSSASNQDLMPFLRKHLQSQLSEQEIEENFQYPDPVPQSWMPAPRSFAGFVPSMGPVVDSRTVTNVMTPVPISPSSRTVSVPASFVPATQGPMAPVATMMPVGPVPSMGPMGPLPPMPSSIPMRPVAAMGPPAAGYGSLNALNAS